MARRDLSCTDCGEPMWRVKRSLPDGSARCQPCRTRPIRDKECTDCRQVRPASEFYSHGPQRRASHCKSCANIRRKRRGSLACAVCGEVIWKGRTSLPQGEATCQPCRRELHRQLKPQPEPRAKARRGSTAERGYGHAHRRLRAYLIETFEDGTPCARCGDPMSEDDPKDLDHTDDRTAYLGLSHAACNRARSGARRTPRISRQPRDCPICGATFKPTGSNVRTCGRACGVAWVRLNREVQDAAA